MDSIDWNSACADQPESVVTIEDLGQGNNAMGWWSYLRGSALRSSRHTKRWGLSRSFP
jgi:hypothetical protein